MPTSTIVACSQCCNVTLYAASLEYASVSQYCSATNCGETPCTSTAAVYDSEGNCTTAAQVCSPNWAELTPAEKCAAQRYLTITTEDLRGGVEHGLTKVKQYTTDDDGNCDSGTTCSGTRETKFRTVYNVSDSYVGGSYTYLHDVTETTVDTWNSDCTITTAVTCEGTSNTTRNIATDSTTPYTLTCTSQIRLDCSTFNFNESCSGCGPEFVGGAGSGESCVEYVTQPSEWQANKVDTVTFVPPVLCKITRTYTEANEQGLCTPKTLPAYPAFNGCENDDLVDPPVLAPGQGYNSEAYFFEQPNNPANSSKQSVRYRASFPPPSSCYLKIWFRHRVQKWEYDDCSYAWSTDGPPTYVNAGFFEWNGEGPPCLNDLQAPANACVNKIYSTAYTLVAAKNTSVQVEWKTSINVNNPEPAWPQL